MSGEYPYTVSGYHMSADSALSLISTGAHPILPAQNIQPPPPPHLGQSHAPTQLSPSSVPTSTSMARLKVEDALSYLDRVKQQFSSTPGVYNEFLDIMKKFKAQSIDTPGVINQVSLLFNGHPELMKGFNAFLPSGYKVPGSKSEPSESKPGSNFASSSFEFIGRQPQRVVGENGIESQGVIPVGDHAAGLGSATQPVEFNHAINYVNKIKSRYQTRPEVYKTFLDILHVYQKDQKVIKDSAVGTVGPKTLSENEVYRRVSDLFRDQPDLLDEFSQFLPDAGINSSFMARMISSEHCSKLGESESALLSLCGSTATRKPSFAAPSSSSIKPSSSAMKTANRRRLSSTSSSAQPPTRKFKPDSSRDLGLADSTKFCTLHDFVLFDKIHRILGDTMYNDFLRCLKCYNINELRMTTEELMLMINPFTQKMPELKKHMKELLKQKEESAAVDSTATAGHHKDKTGTEPTIVFDYHSCKVVGQSYRTLPRDQVQQTCSGRTELCYQVLNDKYVSCPLWSEDSSSVIKKTLAEEKIFVCEDERFQCDITIANFQNAITCLKFVQKKLENMAEEEITKRCIDNAYSNFSESLLRIAIKRVYAGEAPQVLDRLKKIPLVAIPVVLERLKSKKRELCNAKKVNIKLWNEQNQKYYLKSLDHQGINFKQMDTKQMRSKALVQEITTVREERLNKVLATPHLELVYQSQRSFEDATSLIIHHVKRQTSIHQDEKQKIKHLLKRFLPDLFCLPRGDLSDDEEMNESLSVAVRAMVSCKPTGPILDARFDRGYEKGSMHPGISAELKGGCSFSLLYGNQNWYVFFRLHQMLCDRLHHFFSYYFRHKSRDYDDSQEAVRLGYRVPFSVEPHNYYHYFLEMVKSQLDGNLETSAYEENLREMFTVEAYLGYTMDKLIQIVVRQLQYLVTDNTSVQLMELCSTESSLALVPDVLSHHSFRPKNELCYQRKVEQLLAAGDFIYRVAVLRKHLAIDQKVTNGCGPVVASEKWIMYMDQYLTGDEPVSAECLQYMKKNPLYLNKNLTNSKTKKAAVLDSAAKKSIDDVRSIAEMTLCCFKANSFDMQFVTDPNTFMYKEPKRLQPPEVKLSKMESVRKKRSNRLSMFLDSRRDVPPGSADWFVAGDKRKTLKPFNHASFCSNCRDF